jgi:peptide deformylase
MAILPVRIYGDPVLRQHAERLTDIDGSVSTLVKNMLATMKKQKGIGLAAPQVGLNKRLFVIDASEVTEEEYPPALINPEIIGTHGEAIYEEGCLSFPGVYFDVRRPRQVAVRYRDLDSKEHTIEDNGILARIILHEYDHLEGRLFIDLLTEQERRNVESLMRQKGIIPAES